MTVCRIRLERDSPATGAFDWATLDDNGTVLDSGTAPQRQPPTTGTCELLLASDLVQLARIAVPAAQQRRIASALRYLVEDIAIADPERLHVAAAGGRAKDVLEVGIIDRQWLAQALERLQRTGLSASSASPECLLPELPDRAWVAVCNGGASFARTGEYQGFALDIADDGDGDAPAALKLALEEARTLGSAPARIVVRMAGEAATPAIGRWAATLGIPVEWGAKWHWAKAPQRSKLELLQGEFAPRNSQGTWLRELRRSALLAAALAFVALAGIAVDWGVKASERNSLTAQMAQLFRSSFGDNAVVVDAPLQMSRALVQLRRQTGQIVADDFLALLGGLSQALLDPAKMRIDSIAYGNGALTLVVRPNDASQSSALLADMRARLPVSGLDIKLDAAVPGGKISLRATPAPAGGR